LFESFLRDGFNFGQRAAGMPVLLSNWGPAVDVEETDKDIRIRAEIPGVKADDLEISSRGDALVIAGEKKESEERGEGGYYYQERRFGSFRREVTLPTAVDADDVKAEYANGILTVELKKTLEALTKKIAVKTT
jgi:HSP20 family protein